MTVEPMIKYGVYLRKADAAKVRKFGDGNLSAGLRMLAEAL